MKLTLAEAIKRLHTFILIIAIAGWVLPYQSWLEGYVALLGTILVQWLFLDNKCILTIWENRLRNGSTPETAVHDETFIARTVNHLCGWQPSDNLVNLVSYVTIIILMAIAVARLRYNI